VPRRVAEEPEPLGVEFQDALGSHRLLGDHIPFLPVAGGPAGRRSAGAGRDAPTRKRGIGLVGQGVINGPAPDAGREYGRCRGRIPPRGDSVGGAQVAWGGRVWGGPADGFNATAFDPMLARDARGNQKTFRSEGRVYARAAPRQARLAQNRNCSVMK
jgi:hypothetical protein